MNALGSYLGLRWTPKFGLILNTGLRYSYTQLAATFSEDDPISWPPFYIDGIQSENQALTWAVGITQNLASGWQFRALAATAFRSPNIDDFAKFREKNGYISVPNPELTAEKALTGEITMAKTFGNKNKSSIKPLPGSLKISATGFYTQLEDAIVRGPHLLPDGSPILVNGLDTFQIQANVNSDRAFVYGASGNLHWQISKSWSIRSGINYTYGRRSFINEDESSSIKIDTLLPLDHIPPLYGSSELAYHSKILNVEFSVRYSGKKATEDYAVTQISPEKNGNYSIIRSGSSDNIEKGVIDPDTGAFMGVYSWTTFNINASLNFTKNFSLNAGVENITDLHYRQFSSGLSAPGRNFKLGLRGRF